jgi:hypothetical protein
MPPVPVGMGKPAPGPLGGNAGGMFSGGGAWRASFPPNMAFIAPPKGMARAEPERARMTVDFMVVVVVWSEIGRS